MKATLIKNAGIRMRQSHSLIGDAIADPACLHSDLGVWFVDRL